jgi:hypothetical protein
MGGMDWINLAEDRERWRALVNAVMNLQVPWSKYRMYRLQLDILCLKIRTFLNDLMEFIPSCFLKH